MNQVWDMVGWFSAIMIENYTLKIKMFLGQIRGGYVLI